MAQINTDVNLHDIVMLALSRSDSTDPVEVAQKYMEIRSVMLDELRKHTNPGTMVIIRQG